jgi:hypothetical protein
MQCWQVCQMTPRLYACNQVFLVAQQSFLHNHCAVVHRL